MAELERLLAGSGFAEVAPHADDGRAENRDGEEEEEGPRVDPRRVRREVVLVRLYRVCDEVELRLVRLTNPVWTTLRRTEALLIALTPVNELREPILALLCWLAVRDMRTESLSPTAPDK